MNHDLPEMIVNIPVHYAPAEAFPHVHGVHNYTTVTPEPTIYHPQILRADPDVSHSYRSRHVEYPERISVAHTPKPTAGDNLDIILFLGSIRVERNATRVGDFVADILRARGHRVNVVDPREYNLAVLEQPLHFYKDVLAVPDYLTNLNEQIKAADAFVVVSAEYNSAISPALCSLLDHFPPSSYAYRPSAIVVYSTGQFGGIRAAMQLRQHLSDLQMVHIPKMTVIPKVEKTLSADGGLVTITDDFVLKSAEAMTAELEWYALALRERRQNLGLPSTFSRRA